jgi:hypothetical protein
MADRPKTKEEFIKFLDKEIEKMDNEITGTLKKFAGYPFGFGGWNYKAIKWEGEIPYYYVNVKIITPDVKVSPAFLVDNEFMYERAKEMDIPKEWLNDRDFYKKFKKYMIYEAIYETYLPIIKDKIIRLTVDLYGCVKRAEEKLEKVI